MHSQRRSPIVGHAIWRAGWCWYFPLEPAIVSRAPTRLVNLAPAWAEEYALVTPAVSVEVAGGGSAPGIASLIDGTADMSTCSRRREPAEFAASSANLAATPLNECLVGHDALAIYMRPVIPWNRYG